MLQYSIVFFVISLLAAFAGFGDVVPADVATLPKMLFVIFLVGSVITFLMSLGRRT